MIENINVQAKDASQGNVAGILPNTKPDAKAAAGPVIEGGEASGSVETADSEETFQQSMLKAINDIALETDISDDESGGNILPIASDLTGNTAENDRQQLPAGPVLPGLNLQEIDTVQQLDKLNEAESKPVTEPAKTTSIDNALKAEPAASLISSSIRQLLHTESKSQGQSALSQPINTANMSQVTDNIVNKQADAVPQTLEGADLLTSKVKLSGLTQELPVQQSQAQQLQALAEIKNASLLPSAAVKTDSGIEALPLSLNPSLSGSLTTTPLSGVAQTAIAEPFGRPAWSEGMSKQILWMANQNIRSAEIRLNPANLGPIEVRIEMSEDQINVALSSRHAVVREAMEMALPKLRDMLDSNGLNLADTDISQHSFAEQRENNTAQGQKHIASDVSAASVSVEAGDTIIRQTQDTTGMVDYYI